MFEYLAKPSNHLIFVKDFSEIETTFQISEIEEFGKQKYPKKFVYSVKSRIRMIRNDFQPCMHAYSLAWSCLSCQIINKQGAYIHVGVYES